MKKHRLLDLGAIAFLFFAFAGISMAQTTHNVTVTNNLFSPANITIVQGDIVKWTCTQGTHNVNGTKTTYPSNPLSFGNAVQSATWTYSFTFSSAGQYSYRCDPHFSMGMVGTVTVTTATDIDNNELNANASVFVDKANKRIVVKGFQGSLNGQSASTLQIFNTTGALVYSNQQIDAQTSTVDISNWAPTIYLYAFTDSNGKKTNGKFLVTR